MGGDGARTALAKASTGAASTLLRTLVNERHLRTPKAFRSQFLRAAAELAVVRVGAQYEHPSPGIDHAASPRVRAAAASATSPRLPQTIGSSKKAL